MIERGPHAADIEIPRPALWEIDITHSLQRDAYQQIEVAASRLNKSLYGYVIGDVMSGRAPTQREKGKQS
jgi:hypothetical protein